MQFAGAMGEQGVKFTLTVPSGSQHALSRQVRLLPPVRCSGQGFCERHLRALQFLVLTLC